MKQESEGQEMARSESTDFLDTTVLGLSIEMWIIIIAIILFLLSAIFGGYYFMTKKK
jgi:flagellar basal body-associated protein FliL